MSLDAHRRAEQLAAQGDVLLQQERRDEALLSYRGAGDAEAEAFLHVPEERPRTRAVVAVSAVALLRKAEAYDEAVRLAQPYLSEPGLPQWGQDQLEELLLDIRHTQDLQ